MKKLISVMAAAVFATSASVAASASTPGAIEDWGCDITNFFDESNTDTLLKVVYQNSASDPTGWNIGFKFNQTDWEESNAVYPYYQSPDESTVTFTITRDQLLADTEAKFGGEIGDILWAEVRTGGDASLVSVEYLPEAAEAPAETPAEDPASSEEPKGSPDTGVEGVAAFVGLAALAGGVVVASRRRK